MSAVAVRGTRAERRGAFERLRDAREAVAAGEASGWQAAKVAEADQRDAARAEETARLEGRRAEHAARTAARLGLVPGELPAEVRDWVARLDHAPKREYAAAYCAHAIGLGPEPADPGAPWAVKARKRADRLFREAFDAVGEGRAEVRDGQWHFPGADGPAEDLSGCETF